MARSYPGVVGNRPSFLVAWPMPAWHFRDGKVTGIFTLQDQFAMLKQIGYLPDSVRAA